MNELSIEAKLENLEKVQDFIREQLGDIPLKIKNQINITAEEIFSNIARYAYKPSTGIAILRIHIDECITIEFEDKGTAHDPLLFKEPDISLSLEERHTGGLGIFMVKKLMDSVEYRCEDNKNILTIKKKI